MRGQPAKSAYGKGSEGPPVKHADGREGVSLAHGSPEAERRARKPQRARTIAASDRRDVSPTGEGAPFALIKTANRFA